MLYFEALPTYSEIFMVEGSYTLQCIVFILTNVSKNQQQENEDEYEYSYG